MKKVTFTAEQTAIITTTDARAIVRACPGSGKTYTLCARVRRLLDLGVPPEFILVLCFSNAAVDELKQRLPDGVRVQTFHAYALSLVRAAASTKSRHPVLLTPTRTVQLLSSALKSCPNACSSVRQKAGITLRSLAETKGLAAFIRQCNGSDEVAARLVQDGKFSPYADVLAELRTIRGAYDKLVEKTGAVDYPGMLRRAQSLVQTAPLRYTHLFVDESQDMDAAQAQLLMGLAAQIQNLMVFGDPNQAVFGFIGGKARDMGDVMRDAVTMRLTRSFRLTHENAALANAIMEGGGSQIVGDRHGVTPSLVACDSVIAQEDKVVNLVEQLKANRPGESIAILTRTKAPVRAAEQALLAANVETDSMYSPRLPMHVDRVLDMLSLVQMCVFTAKAGRKPKKIWRTRRLQEVIGQPVRPVVVADCLRMLAKAARIPSFEGRYVMATRIYLRLARAAGDMPKNLASELGRWQATSRRFRTVAALRAHISELREQEPVVTSTIHGAKGREWDHVLVLNVTEGSIPFYREVDRNETDEERRLFYVAVTRPRKTLHLLQAPFAHAPSRKQHAEPSCFLTESVLETLS
jgi:DNA helicase-2/ATP-dependent DNA helicase PcrA